MLGSSVSYSNKRHGQRINASDLCTWTQLLCRVEHVVLLRRPEGCPGMTAVPNSLAFPILSGYSLLQQALASIGSMWL